MITCDFDDGTRCTAQPTEVWFDETNRVVGLVCTRHGNAFVMDGDKNHWDWTDEPLIVEAHIALADQQ